MAVDKDTRDRENKARRLWEDFAEVTADLKKLAEEAPKVSENKRDQFRKELSEANLNYQKEVAADASAMGDAIETLKKKLADARRFLQPESNADEVKEAHDFYEKLKSYLEANRGNEGVFSFRKAILQATGLIGSKNKVAGFLSKLKQAPGAAYAKTIEKALQLTENNRYATKVVKSIDKVAKTVKLVGTESLTWLGKKIKDLSFMLWRFIKMPAQWIGKGAGLLSTLFPIAMLAPFIKDMLAVIDKELTERYGEHYVKAILKDLWDKAWKELKDSWAFIKEWSGKIGEEIKIYLKDVWDKLSKTLEDSFNGIQKFFSDQLDAVKVILSKVAEFLLPKDLIKTEPIGTMFGAKEVLPSNSTRTPKEKSVNQIITEKLKAYKDYKKGPQKTAARANLQNDLTDGVSVPDQSLDLSTVTNLRNEGFKVSDSKVLVLNNTIPDIPASSAAPVAEASPTPAPVQTATPVQASQPEVENGGVASTKPVTAIPLSEPGSEASSSQQVSSLGNNSVGGLSVKTIPTHAGDDQLLLINHGVGGMA